MEQVMDAIRLFEEAEIATGGEEKTFEWKLESATTNSPFRVVAVAAPLSPHAEIAEHVKAVKAEMSRGVRRLISEGIPAAWMRLDMEGPVRRFLARNQNGIGHTDIEFTEADVLSIDAAQANAGTRAIQAISIIDVAADLQDREAFGELPGIMVAAGRYSGKPAIQIKTEQYGLVWCLLNQRVIEQFGGTHRMEEVWEGKSLGVTGTLIYKSGGRLVRVLVHQIREIQDAPHVDLESLLDPNFTAGFDPAEYLTRLHEGELA
jgi:hypothetical protein